MPVRWPSIRAMARWVLPVLVGPRTATSRGAGRNMAMPYRYRVEPPRGQGQTAQNRRCDIADEGSTVRRPLINRRLGRLCSTWDTTAELCGGVRALQETMDAARELLFPAGELDGTPIFEPCPPGCERVCRQGRTC